MAKTFLELIEKFNPWHDAKGRFTTGGNASFMTIRTKDPSKQKWADMAVARAKEAEAKKKPDFAGQISSIRAESDKIKQQITDLQREEKECADQIQKLSKEGFNLKWYVDAYDEKDAKFDKQKMENFDTGAANKRIADIDAELEKLHAESDMWYRDRPERGTPEYDEWRKYRDEHDINDIINKINTASEEKANIKQDIREHEKYKEHKAGAEEQEKRKARLAEIDGETEALVTKRLNAQDRISELAKQNEVNIKKAGVLVADELSRTKTTAKDNSTEIKELSDRRSKIYQEGSALSGKYFRGEITYDEYQKMRRQANKQLRALDDEISVLKNGGTDATALKSTLSKVRSMGIENEESMNAHLPGRSTEKQTVKDAYDLYPTDWINKSTEAGAIKVSKTDRGYYTDASRGELKISGPTKDARHSTAIHELGHRMEEVVPGMLSAQQAFYNRRTAGEQVESLKRLTGLNYATNEYTRKDNFIDPYMGKDYSGKAFELVSMGFEMAYKQPKKLAQDPDYQQFIYGLLAIG